MSYFKHLSISIIPVLTVTFCYSLTAHGQPTIQSVSGTLQHGEIMTISGQQFQIAESEQRRLWDTVDNQETLNKLSVGSIVPTDQGPWTRNGSPWATPITIGEEARSQRPSSSLVYQGTGKAFLGLPRAFDGSTNRVLYVSWYFKPMKDPDELGGANKFIRIWDSLDGLQTRLAWNQDLIGGESVPDASWSGWNGRIATWNRMEMLIDDRRGIVKAWTNGQLIHNITDFSKENVQDGLTVFLLGFDPNYADRYDDLTFYLDDIYISNTAARVELSNSATWTGSDRDKEVQPVDSWSDSKITFRLNVGNLNAKEPLYLYVVDRDEAVNKEGYEVVLCPKCPVPAELTVE